MKIIVFSSYSYITKVNNYGSILQYFALQTFLERYGHEVRWLRYRSVKTPPKGFSRWVREKILHSNFRLDNVVFHNKEGFDSFIKKHIKLTDEYYETSEELFANPPESDLLIVGSDQVWNGYSPDRYLAFAKRGVPKISYAVSFGKSHISKYLWPLLWYYIRDFKAISIRERSGANLCHKLGRKDAKYVIDPSFLLSKEDYGHIIQSDGIKSISKDTYVYGYFVNPFPNNDFHIANALNEYLDVTNLSFYVTGIQKAELALADYDIIQPSPLEWVNYIMNAKSVITNSFHGVAFAINLQKPFLLIVQKGAMSNQNCRYLNLLERLGLEERIYSEEKGNMMMQMEKPIDWVTVNQKREDFIKESVLFLYNAING